MADEVTYLTIGCEIIQSTNKAIKIEPDKQSGEEFWIPKSLLSHSDYWIDDLSRGDSIELQIAEWFCNKEGIEG